MQPCKSVVVDVTTLLQVVITLREVDISSTLYSMFLQLATPVAIGINVFQLASHNNVVLQLERKCCLYFSSFICSNFFHVFLHVNGLTVTKRRHKKKIS